MAANILELLNENKKLPFGKQLSYVWKLSIPGILSQISSIAMQYIDAAMVGSLGAGASAAIGLVASTTWLFGSLSMAFSTGFSVQIAQAVGAGDFFKAKGILRQAIIFCLILSSALMIIGIAISFYLPVLLGAEKAIHKDASMYFLIFAISIPMWQIIYLFGSSLQAAGDMKAAGILNALMCLLDVAFNYLFIMIFKMGVTGAAIGTLISALVTGILMCYRVCIHSKILSLKEGGSWSINGKCLTIFKKISIPLAFQQFALTGAQVVSSGIVAPLGMTAIAANSFAVTAEALCYMPGFGIGGASTALVGQAIGAKRKDAAWSLAWCSIFMGMGVMALAGAFMYFFCPFIFNFLTPDIEVQKLGTTVLRIELFAEPMFAAAIVANHALRGAGDTLIPGIMALGSMWGVRLPLAFFLSKTMGLNGVWIAMAVELCFRGTIFLIRTARGKWLKNLEEF